MRYGNCVSYKNAGHIKILKNAGFDYIETGLAALYTAEKQEIKEFIGALRENNIKCEAVNVLFPGGITLTGENAEFGKVKDYVDAVFEKTKEIGFETVVFGSGGARKCPDGFPKEKATEQIIEIIQNYLAPAAEKYNFTLAIEELNNSETNILNKISEVEYIISKVNHPKIKLLADLYHMGLENDDINGLTEDITAHCHIANPFNKRYYPQKSDSDKAINLYKDFFNRLKQINYNKKISIEGGLGGLESPEIKDIPDWVDENDRIFYIESKKSLEFMRGLN